MQAMDLRFVCTTCGTKWFARPGEHSPEELSLCGACDGPLVPFTPEAHDSVRDAFGAAHQSRFGSG